MDQITSLIEFDADPGADYAEALETIKKLPVIVDDHKSSAICTFGEINKSVYRFVLFKRDTLKVAVFIDFYILTIFEFKNFETEIYQYLNITKIINLLLECGATGGSDRFEIKNKLILRFNINNIMITTDQDIYLKYNDPTICSRILQACHSHT